MLANHAAGLVVAHVGTAVATRAELIGSLEDVALGEVLSFEDALRRRPRPACASQTFVFTNGCFDILHPGTSRFCITRSARGTTSSWA